MRREPERIEMRQIVSDPRNVETAYALQYENLAKKIVSLVRTRNGTLVEVGCGEGQLTIHLAKLLPRHRFSVVDAFTGAYSGALNRLSRALSGVNLKNRVKVHRTDYLDWLREEFSDKYVGVISSEFLPEIDSYELSMFVSECYRVVRPGGLTVHSFLSPIARNRRQKLLIEADSNPKWTKTPPKEWFSPEPALVLSKLRRVGFRDLRIARLESNLIIKSSAARNLLHSWDVRSRFWKTHKVELASKGLEVPDWVIVSGRKP
ncbi:MAG TPA: class I SAM-dependent methyltransferase [Candidatus Bathyarchaeia archaeon]|nr:class I SAM-dependent methyltransferase [Candidatus Bathyarchaeia archaeon]